jgi:two-component system phosphate regulon sensor histidine kinase PhoR
MQREINRLAEMATAFLDVARLESGRLQFRQEEVNLAALLEECLQVVSSRADEKQQHLQLRLKGRSLSVRGDADKLKQVVLNLLSNAIKYTPDGGAITLSASAEKDGVRLCVSDSGVGIPPEHLPFIFEKFYRVPDAWQTAQGSGLGLFIVKRIVEAHGGRVEARSTVGEGTQITVWLPKASS